MPEKFRFAPPPDDAFGPTSELAGKIQVQYVRCGKATCRCAKGQPHGPYYYRTWRDGMRTRKVYVKNEDIDAVSRACENHAHYKQLLRELRAQRRSVSSKLRQEWRHTQSLLSSAKKPAAAGR